MNIFSALQKYKPNDCITPEENYFTAAFTVILNEFPKLGGQIVKELLPDKQKLPFTKLKFLHQERHGSSCIIDLEVRDKNRTLLLIEVKLNAKEGNKQLARYCKLKKGTVVYITKHFEERDDKLKINHFYWSQIYDIIENYTKKNTDLKNKYLLKAFLEFMEEHDMQGFRGLRNEGSKKWKLFMQDVYIPHRELIKKIWERLDRRYDCAKITETFDYIYPQHSFYFYPKNKKSAFEKARIYPFCSLYLNDKAIANGADDFKAPEGVFLSVGVCSKKLADNNDNVKRQPKRELIHIEKNKGEWLAKALINDIKKNDSSIKGQLSKAYDFCDKAILTLNKELKKQDIKINI